MRFVLRAFAALTPFELHALMAIRQRVFVVEQSCPYLDADDHDLCALHLWASLEPTKPINAVIACLRILPPGEKYAEPSLGRVVTSPEVRRTGAGRAIVARGILELEHAFGRVPIRISAQQYLERFYGEFGFVTQGEAYLEDGIPHVEMKRPASVP